MTDAQTKARPRIDDPQEFERVVHRLVDGFDPVAVYLFGSRARGDAGEDSDYDLMLVLADDNERVRSRQALWDTARSERIDVNPFLSRVGAFDWRRREIGTLEYEVQVDGIRVHPASGADLRAGGHRTGGRKSMNIEVVKEGLGQVERDLRAARLCCGNHDAVPDRAAYHVQQAAEKLTKAALVAHEIRPRKGHVIGQFAKRLPRQFPDRDRFLALERFTKFVWVHRYPDETGAAPEPMPAVEDVKSWIAEVDALEANFERWLAAREAAP